MLCLTGSGRNTQHSGKFIKCNRNGAHVGHHAAGGKKVSCE